MLQFSAPRRLLLVLLLLVSPVMGGWSGVGTPDRSAQTEEEDGDEAEGTSELRLIVAIRRGRGPGVHTPTLARQQHLPTPTNHLIEGSCLNSLTSPTHLPRPPGALRLLI